MIVNILAKITTTTSGCYQTLDMSSLFKMTREYFKKMTTTTSDSTYRRKVEEMFDKLNRSSSLNPHKSHNMTQNIIDVASEAPQAYQVVFTRDRIVRFFSDYGYC